MKHGAKPASNQADEPDGKNDAVLRKYRASLKGLWPAGYPQSFGLQKYDENKDYL